MSLAEDKEEDGSPTELLLGAGGCPIVGLTLLPRLSSLLTNLPLILSFSANCAVSKTEEPELREKENLNFGSTSGWFCFFFIVAFLSL